MGDVKTSLSPAELQVLQLTAEGLSTWKIAILRRRSQHTIRAQRDSIRTKLDAATMVEAVSKAARAGILEL